MSSTKGLENKGNKGILTRQSTQSNPELKKQVDERNNEANVFGRKPRVQRSPPRTDLIKFTSHTYENVPSNKTTEENTEKTSIPTTSRTDLNAPEITDSQAVDNLEQNQNITESTQERNIPKIVINNLLIPEIKQETITPEFYTANTPGKNLQFFDESIHLGDDKLNDYTDIEGLLNQQSLILANENNIINNEREEIEINENLIDFEPEMANQQLKLPLKDVAKIVPEFDGKNMEPEEYIEKLQQAKNIIADADERNLVQLLRIKLKGEVYKALKGINIPTIEILIESIRKIYPSKEDIHTLYGKLIRINQEPNETVLEYANNVTEIGDKIIQLKSLESGITEDNLTAFKTKLETDILNCFKDGLKSELRFALGEHENLSSAIQKAINLEANTEKRNMIKKDTATILYNFEKSNINTARIYRCQICKDNEHEALFCDNASCVYCKNKDHMSFLCNVAKDKIELICKFCSSWGHSMDTCKLNHLKGIHCQYCQEMGHTATSCSLIKKYELCWKCKEKGHSPNVCEKSANVAETCEFCGNMSHTMKNCPSVVCQRCNKPGHIMKYCQVTRKTIWCTICKLDGHEVSDCQTAGIMTIQGKQQAFGNKINCQICEAITHTAAYCPERNISSQRNNNYANINPNYRNSENKYTYHTLSNSRNTNGFNKIQQQGYHPRNTNFNEQINIRNEPNQYCEFCKIPGHTIVNCRKLQKTETTPKCAYCKRKGHTIGNCNTLKNLESKQEKFCNFCKSTTHSLEECFRKPSYEQTNSGNL